MEHIVATPTRNGEQHVYYEYDVVAIPGDIPELQIREGDTGVVENLDLRNNTIFARVRVYRSTGQTKGMVEMQVRPQQEIVSHAAA